jgi:hypothetical protein
MAQVQQQQQKHDDDAAVTASWPFFFPWIGLRSVFCFLVHKALHICAVEKAMPTCVSNSAFQVFLNIVLRTVQ